MDTRGPRTRLWARGRRRPAVFALARLALAGLPLGSACVGAASIASHAQGAAVEPPLDASASTAVLDATAGSLDTSNEARLTLAALDAPDDPYAPELADYLFGSFESPEDNQLLATTQRRLEAPGGIGKAIRRLCDFDAEGRAAAEDLDGRGYDVSRVEDLVTTNFLIAHADQTYPALLEAAVHTAKMDTETAGTCRSRIENVLREGACSGYDPSGGANMDAHPIAEERRSRARHALVRALEKGGPQATEAMDLWLDHGADPSCYGLRDIVRDMTPALVARLGTPPATPRIPRSFGGVEWERALRVLSFGGASREVAEQPVRAFLAEEATAPLAALALARMGVDVSAMVPRLAHVLDATVLDRHMPPSGDFWDQLTHLQDTLDALREIGAPAHSALPSVAAIVLRVEIPRPACITLGAARYAAVVRAIATPADGDVAAKALVPLLACAGPSSPILRAWGEIGAPARPFLLLVLRDDDRPIEERLDAMKELAQMGQPRLAGNDQRLVALLEAKRPAWPALRHSRSWDTDGASELARCRAEAGLPPLALPTRGGGARWEVATCTSKYLCGPAVLTYKRTLARCCHTRDPRYAPPLCLGFVDAGAAPKHP